MELEPDVACILIIGYGNLLCGDDAAGVLAARELEHHFQDDNEVEVIAAQQLTPELAEVVSGSGFVLFLDASQEETPGRVRCEAVEPMGDPRLVTHHLTPASLLSTAQRNYGQAPPAASLTLAGRSFALSNELSPIVRERLPEFIRQAKEIVASHRWLVGTPIASGSPVG